jgi:translation initiation factor IF-3
VRLIGDEKEQLGVMPIEKARDMAQEAGLDLVEVSPKTMPPVCKIMDYGKYLYRLNKAEQKQKKGQIKTEVKGIRLGFNTGQHDLDIKLGRAKEFLGKKNLVKVALILKGREAAYKDLAKEKMREFAKSLENEAVVDSPPKAQGYQITMMLKPKS